MNFIGNKNIDTHILLNLNDHDLYSMRLTNSYFNNICDESFWRNRLLVKFSELGNMQEIKRHMSYRSLTLWKKYYIVLSQFIYKHFLFEIDDVTFELEDIKKLKEIIDNNNNNLTENIEKFIMSNLSEIKSCTENISAHITSQINIQKCNLFLDAELSKHLINPNFIMLYFQHGLDKIMDSGIFGENSCLMCDYIYIIMKYLLERKDGIATPVYDDFSFFKHLTKYDEACQCQSMKTLFKLTLNDTRTDLNRFFDFHTIRELRILDYLDLILNDNRIKFETLDKYIYDLLKSRHNYENEYEPEHVLKNNQKIIDKYISLGGSVDIFKFFHRNERGLLNKIMEKY